MQRFDAPTPISAEARPAGRSAFGSFARFVLFGGGVGLASSAVVPVVATLMPWVAANALITVASTLVGTELHARFTFGAGRRAQWHQHLQSAGSATAAYLVTSAAILVLHAVQPSASMRWEQAVYLSASGLAGTGRFLVLRLYVFAAGRTPGADLDRRGCARHWPGAPRRHPRGRGTRGLERSMVRTHRRQNDRQKFRQKTLCHDATNLTQMRRNLVAELGVLRFPRKPARSPKQRLYRCENSA
jgi:putative flippase GtrA